MEVTPRCTCYIENARPKMSKHERGGLSAVVECPKHSTPALRELRRRGHECARERDERVWGAYELNRRARAHAAEYR